MAVIDGKWLSKEGLIYFWSKIKAIFTKQTETNVIANFGAKNILTPTLTSESTQEGITCTPNPDGTFTLNGTFPTTSSKTNVFFIVVSNAKIKELSNKYGAINVICSGGSDIERSQGRLRFYRIDTNKVTYDSSATDKEISLTLSDNIMDSSANIAIVVYRGQTLNNVVIRPMIRPAEITDDTFKPYAPTNRELYETSQQSYDFIFGLGTELKSNDDLNNYNKVGKIYAATGAIAATISNTPWTSSGFVVITIPLLTTKTFMQFLLPSSFGGKWYRRRYTQGVWSAWIEYDGTQITASQSASSASLMQTGPIDVELSDAGDDEPEEEER